MSQYYYLAAQLPNLVYGQGVPMSSQAFSELAREHLSPQDAGELDCCTLDAVDNPCAKSEFVQKWNEWEKSLRLNLAKNRAKKLKREDEAAFDAIEYPFDAAAAAKTANSIESPLDAEIFLDKARWTAIEHLQGFDAFSANAIYAYKLKLLLMERLISFNAEEGYNEYKRLYAAIFWGQK